MGACLTFDERMAIIGKVGASRLLTRTPQPRSSRLPAHKLASAATAVPVRYLMRIHRVLLSRWLRLFTGACLLLFVAAACLALPPAAAPPAELPSESIAELTAVPTGIPLEEVAPLPSGTEAREAGSTPAAATNPIPPLPGRATATPVPTLDLFAILPTVTPTPRADGLTVAAGVMGRLAAAQPATTGEENPDASGVPTNETRVTVTGAVVNLRGGPGTNYPNVGQARQSDSFVAVGRNEAGSWLRVCCPVGETTETWISADFVRADVATSLTTLLPVVEAPPPPAVAAPPARGAQSATALAAAPAPGMPGPGGFGPPGDTNPLTGLPLPGGRNSQRPVIVCINNDFAARPQLGMSQADVVYEYLMEGYGITRFSAIYYGSDAGQVGPVRSARLINYYMGALYDAGLVCSGASDGVRYSLKHEAPFPYMDIDLDDASNTRYSVSVGSDYRTRLRTSTDKTRRWLADWGVDKAPSLRSFTFGSPVGGGLPATSITIPYPRGTGSQVSYVYDGGSGRYLRSMGGAAHVDGNTGAQLALDNVIVQVVAHEATNIVEDSLGSTSIRLNLFGSGAAIVFRDGQAYPGTWRSESRGDLPRFYDANGAEISLKPGRTWISVVPPTYTIGYQ